MRQQNPIYQLLLCLSFACLSQLGFANNDSTIRVGILPFEGPAQLQYINQRFQDYALEIFSRDKRFQLLEREQLRIIWQERELQKQEDFLDGYVVEQFQSLGADYLLRGVFDPNLDQLRLDLISVKNRLTAAKEVVKVIPDPNQSRKNINAAVNRMIEQVFPKKRPVKIIDILKSSKKKAQKVLLLGGSSNGLRRYQRLLVKKQELREVDGERLIRDVTVGRIMISEIENANFSRCTVLNGGDAILQAIEDDETLFCIPE